MADLEQPANSTEPVFVPVQKLGGPIPVGATCRFAFVPVSAGLREPLVDEWRTGTFETIGGSVFASLPVGPLGEIALDATTYHTWTGIDSGTDHPIRRVGTLKIGA